MGEQSPQTIPELLAATVERVGDQVAVVDTDRTLSYADLLAQARGFAAALVARGVRTGDRVSIWMPNSWRWIVAVLGIWQAGGVLVPINTRFKGTEAADILRRAGVRLLVSVTDFLDTDYVAMLEGAELPELADIVIASGAPTGGAIAWDDFLAAATSDATRIAAIRRNELSADHPSDILFTSGTTGQPKGVVMTHARTLQVARDWVAMTGLHSGDRYLMVNPYFHMFGLKAGILASVAAGATMYPEPVFDVERVLSRVGEERITVLPGAPTIYQAILDHPDRKQHDLSSLRVAVTGAADIPVALIRRIYDELPFEVVVSGYGLTEAGTATGTGPEDGPEEVATTVGRVRPGFEVRLTDAGGNDVLPGEAGEILLRGPSVMSHYLDDPKATAAALSDDGWLRTGDIGRLDPDGLLRIVGRVKDMFIVGGFNAYPAEIENLLLGHPAIRAVAVVGIPDERLGEVCMAFVVLEAGATATPEEIIVWSRDHMANYKAPRRVEILEALPLNATGKVMKEQLRARAAG
ncbi:MAG TPA: FadD3 family acyl-CoA ligase [Mycobacteriales bacterium]|nr:FadD3 family acyl-CoA ligase [Mycobacteriales bacterium]